MKTQKNKFLNEVKTLENKGLKYFAKLAAEMSKKPNQIKNMSTYNKIYVARIIVEADTPLFVGSGEVGLLSDMQVQRDHLGLPMIMGTTLAGVLRNEFQSNKKKDFTGIGNERKYTPSPFETLFGYHEENFGQGSRVRISSAYLMLNERECVQGLGQK